MARPRRRQPRTKDVELADRMLAAYVRDDMTLDQVSARHGLSRERCRQIMVGRDWTLYGLTQRRRAARTRLRKYVLKGTPTVTAECRVCGETFQRSLQGGYAPAFCSRTHYAVWGSLRSHLAEPRTDHQLTLARSVVKAAGEGKAWAQDEVRLRYARRRLDGETRYVGRWLIPGSLNYHWCLRAYALGWPLFDLLHPDIQAQVRGEEGEAPPAG